MNIEKCAIYLSEKKNFRVFIRAGYDGRPDRLPELSAESSLITHLISSDRPLLRRSFRINGGDHNSVECRRVFDQLQAEVVMSMRFKNQLKGFLVLGEKRSGDLYSREDLDLLETLCHQSALAIENARAYQTLSKLNHSLEAKVQARTRDLAAALEEKERTQEQLIRSESLAALGQLVAGAAHELNNPLASVTSLLQSASEELQDWQAGQTPDQDLLDDLEFADKELARAKSIVASLLGLARQTQTYEEAVDLNLVVSDALRVLHNQYKHFSIQLVQDFKTDLPSIRGNFANLGQVILNVVKNAYQAVSQNTGRIDLSTDYDSQNPGVVFCCKDNGPGIDPDIRKDVFKPFFTTKPVGQGTGLGLYICHEIISRHGGSISIDAAQPIGAQITIRLPDKTSLQ
jgi:C4-dicarboxylate-specific signal transduction histidine kinase